MNTNEILKTICSSEQLACMNFENKPAFIRMAKIFENMPVTYEGTDIAYLHYFSGNCDWYILEKDCLPYQLQAFGYVNLGWGYECGYISIIELIENNIQLDLFFTPQPIKKLIK